MALSQFFDTETDISAAPYLSTIIILVRYYAQDDPFQSSFAFRLFKDEPELFVTKTVLLEFFRVLTQADMFRFSPEQVKCLNISFQLRFKAGVQASPALQAKLALQNTGKL
ncbi:hypothetical protein [Methylobacter sp.]|uniref:hypothetical protein n=1 Tax=Methylobacter sp. TaxID=2051955 RepID=UPI00248905D2|nr:hypothetical protein [Methylobacter sp.]MDI1277451.1 hypothetical protein [Methylobacter sp.]MDI1358090.1 hypothetical protein [Methylobacter sp.]